MNRYFAALFALTIALAAGNAAAGTSYGTPLSAGESTPVSAILTDPESYVGKTVTVEGMIVDVCSRRGCWMELAGDKPFEKIKVKVDDGVIVFPLTARGKRSIVQGTVEAIRMSAEESLAQAKHHAAEKGVPFDPAQVTGPRTLYQIRATGAEID